MASNIENINSLDEAVALVLSLRDNDSDEIVCGSLVPALNLIDAMRIQGTDDVVALLHLSAHLLQVATTFEQTPNERAVTISQAKAYISRAIEHIGGNSKSSLVVGRTRLN